MSMESTIAKLLAKAEGTDNPLEAEALMAKDEELMLKYGIEQANLQAHLPGNRREEILKIRITIRNSHGYAAAMGNIAHEIAPSFSVRSFQTTLDDGGRIIWYVGHKSDIEQAEQLAQSLITQSRSQAMHWWKTEGKQAHSWYTDNQAYLARREFIYAFAVGAGSRLRETRVKIVEDSAPGTALVLVDRTKVVDNWIDSNMSVGKGRATSRARGSASASSAGRQAGRDAVGTKAIR